MHEQVSFQLFLLSTVYCKGQIRNILKKCKRGEKPAQNHLTLSLSDFSYALTLLGERISLGLISRSILKSEYQSLENG